MRRGLLRCGGEPHGVGHRHEIATLIATGYPARCRAWRRRHRLRAAGLHQPGVDDGRLNYISVEVSGTELEVTHGHERGGDPQWWVENAGAIIAGVLADKGAIYREMRV